MCMAIPMEVLRMDGAVVVCRDRDGRELRIDPTLTGAPEVGQWVLTFLGAARAIVSAEEAAQINRAIGALEGLMAGGSVDLDACFADLVNREPQLPPHLRPLSESSGS